MPSNIVPFLFPAAVQSAYKNGLYTDLKIICGKSEFMVHQIIVCSQATFFHAALAHDFRESSDNTIDLTADGISCVSRMMHCLYYGTYAEFGEVFEDANFTSAHQLHAAMYALGDKFDFSGLKDRALANFVQPALINSLQTVRGFIESIPIVYSSTPDSDRRLRDVTVQKIKASPPRFLQEDVKELFQKTLVEVPDLSWDLHQCWMSGMSVVPETTTASAKRKR